MTRTNFAAYHRWWRKVVHPGIEKVSGAIRRKKVKQLAIDHYSDGSFSCAYCGFSDVRALSIDHLDGGGSKERRIHRGNFYGYLVAHDYPDGFQVLCMNCQFIKKLENHEN